MNDKVPAICENDGFDAPAEMLDDRVIVGTQLKFVDRVWSAGGVEMPLGTRLLARGLRRLLQRWEGGYVIDSIETEPFPDLDTLNATIPESEWEIGVDGKPRAPWCLTYVVYLLDLATAEQLTFANNSGGTGKAWRELKDRVATMRAIRGENVYPIVELQSRLWSRRFKKDRPHFEPVDWRAWGTAKATPQLTKVSEPTAAEEMGDSIPF
jgi:hypothetical protein